MAEKRNKHIGPSVIPMFMLKAGKTEKCSVAHVQFGEGF